LRVKSVNPAEKRETVRKQGESVKTISEHPNIHSGKLDLWGSLSTTVDKLPQRSLAYSLHSGRISMTNGPRGLTKKQRFSGNL